MGTRLERIARGKLLEKLARPGIELVWQDHVYRDVVIPAHATLKRRHSLAAQAQASPILRAGRQGHGDLAINRWDLDLGTQEEFGERHRHLTQNVIALACKIDMRSYP